MNHVTSLLSDYTVEQLFCKLLLHILLFMRYYFSFDNVSGVEIGLRNILSKDIDSRSDFGSLHMN
jgi:hypothetical protein